MAEKRAKRLMTPRTWDTADAKGFKAFAEQHYHQMMDLAIELARRHEPTREGFLALTGLFFDKLAAPLVYLYESWEVLPSEEKAKYSAEIAKIREETKAVAEKVFPGVPAVPAAEAEKVPKLDITDIEALNWINFQTKKTAAKGEAGWIFSNTKGAEDLFMALTELSGETLELGEYKYEFSGTEKEFIVRRPRKV